MTMIMMSQRRRPTASARRQRQEARIVEDPRTIVEELNEEQQQPHVEGVIDVEGFLGGPHDTSILRDFENHVALRIWNGEVYKS